MLFGIGLFQSAERADDEGGMRNMSGKIRAKQRGDRRQSDEKSLRLQRGQAQRRRSAQRRAQ